MEGTLGILQGKITDCTRIRHVLGLGDIACEYQWRGQCLYCRLSRLQYVKAPTSWMYSDQKRLPPDVICVQQIAKQRHRRKTMDPSHGGLRFNVDLPPFRPLQACDKRVRSPASWESRRSKACSRARNHFLTQLSSVQQYCSSTLGRTYPLPPQPPVSPTISSSKQLTPIT